MSRSNNVSIEFGISPGFSSKGNEVVVETVFQKAILEEVEALVDAQNLRQLLRRNLVVRGELNTRDQDETAPLLADALQDLGQCSCFGRHVLLLADKALLQVYPQRENAYQCLILTQTRAAAEALFGQVRERLAEYLMDSDDIVEIHWYTSENTHPFMLDIGDDSKAVVRTEVLDDEILPAAYPYIPDLEAWIDGYLESDEQVLLLMGKPGTGKTRLMRHIIRSYRHKLGRMLRVAFTSEDKVLESSPLFLDYTSAKSGLDMLVLEDIDFNLQSRKEGNTFMYKLLSASEGLLRVQRRKILLSTNLASVGEIDEALTRPGRCFDVVNTRLLTTAEAQLLMQQIGGSLPEEGKGEWSLAELYRIANARRKHISLKRNGTPRKKVQLGFV